MNVLIYSLAFITSSLVMFFLLFFIVTRSYYVIYKRNLLSLKYSIRLLLFFLMIASSVFISSFSLEFLGLSFFNSSKYNVQNDNLRKQNEELVSVQKFLDNYENLSLNDLQKELPLLKKVFYNLKEKVDYYNLEAERAEIQYAKTQRSTDSLSQTSDSLKVVTQNQFNVVFAELERRSDEKEKSAFYKGLFLSILSSLVAAYIYDKANRRRAQN